MGITLAVLLVFRGIQEIAVSANIKGDYSVSTVTNEVQIHNNPVLGATKKKGIILLNFRAQQVIDRNENQLPINMKGKIIGKLLLPIDTRNLDEPIQAIVMYSGKIGDLEVSKGSIFIGNATYSEGSDKIFIEFNQLQMSDGKIFATNAQAFESKDYSSGLRVQTHSEVDAKYMAGIGLKVVSGIGEVMAQKVPIGITDVATIRPHIQDALIHGASEAANGEASKQLEKIEQSKPYATLEAGSDLIINIINIKGIQNDGI